MNASICSSGVSARRTIVQPTPSAPDRPETKANPPIFPPDAPFVSAPPTSAGDAHGRSSSNATSRSHSCCSGPTIPPSVSFWAVAPLPLACRRLGFAAEEGSCSFAQRLWLVPMLE
jgi:hypothetical protein